jgi:hypothetical protein
MLLTPRPKCPAKSSLIRCTDPLHWQQMLNYQVLKYQVLKYLTFGAQISNLDVLVPDARARVFFLDVLRAGKGDLQALKQF